MKKHYGIKSAIGNIFIYTACGILYRHNVDVTLNKRKVTCKRCKKTRDYKIHKSV